MGGNCKDADVKGIMIDTVPKKRKVFVETTKVGGFFGFKKKVNYVSILCGIWRYLRMH